MTRGPMGGRARGPIEYTETKHSFNETWGRLIAFCKPYMFVIIIALCCAIGGTVFTIIGPDRLKEITDLITEGLMTGIDLDAIGRIAITLTIMYSLSLILSYSQGFIMATVTQRVSKSLRTKIFEKINKLPLRYFDTTSKGDILSRVTNDIDIIGQTMNQSIGNLVVAITQLGGSAIMMFATNWIMALVALGASIFGFVFMTIIISRSQKYFRQQQVELGAINGHVEEIYSGHNVVKAYNGEKAAKETFDKINHNLYSCAWKSQFMSGLMMPLMTFIGNLGYAAVCISGAYLAINGTISFGVIVAFIIYVRLFTQPLSQIAQAATSLQSTAAASKRVFEFLDEQEQADESEKTGVLENVKGEVEFKNVRFGYSDDRIIINDFSAHANPGQKIAIVGPTGAGKTTMVNLLMKFYEINSGDILIDGNSINKMKREDVHSLFCMVLQDTWLFEGTIRENIIYSKKDVTEEQVISACKSVGLHHFITTLPDGYNTILDEEANLSAGQKQLITIARAIVENAPLLILDEATSSVDTRTEELIQRAMDKLMQGRTSFIIAHRLSTIKNADLILVMKDGDIIESGDHNTLLAQNGFYADLYNSQFEKVS